MHSSDSSFADVDGIWQPEGMNPSQGHLLVVLHGRGDTAEGFDWLQSKLRIEGLSVLCVNAPDPYFTGRSWYGLPPDQLPGILRSREFLGRLFERIAEAGFPAHKCFLLGFSQGCLMTLEFGARFEAAMAGYIGISGYCYDPSQLLMETSAESKRGRWLVTHGTRDEVLDIERTRSQIVSLKAGGLPVDYREYSKGHTIDLREEFPMIRKWILDGIREPEEATRV